MDRATSEVTRHYEQDNPGGLNPVDVKKFALMAPGGGWKIHGREAADTERTICKRRNRTVASSRGSGRASHAYVYSAVDDRSRLAYSEAHDDETFATTIAHWQRAAVFYASHGIAVREEITVNGVAYRAHAWKNTLNAVGFFARFTRPLRPQTNGKVERFHRTLRDEWAYGKTYRSENPCRKALTSWLRI